MFDLGTQELIVIFIVAFLVFGPKRLPELGRTLGKGIRELKTAMRGVKESFDEASSDITEELKDAKSGLEDSIYESIESGINKTSEEKKETGAGPDTKKPPLTDEEKAKKPEETDKDG